MLRQSLALAATLAVLAPPGPLPAQIVQQRVDLTVVQRIRDEGLNRSHIPELASYLTDVVGPRLTGSTNMRKANDWAADRLRGWGLANVHVEPWGRFGKGWERVSFSGRFLDPFVQPLQASALAWSGSTRGTVTGPVVYVALADTTDFAKYRGKLKGAFVMRDTFTDLGVVAVRPGNTGGTDHLAFDAAGVPGFNFIQDPIEYGTRTHHTEADSYERLVLDDLKQAATVIAFTAYHLANRDDPMPRKPARPATGGN